VPVLPRLAEELRAHRNVLRAVYVAGDAAGLNGDGREPVGVHDLRHSFVAVALAAGLTLRRLLRLRATPIRE
jgi:integrase